MSSSVLTKCTQLAFATCLLFLDGSLFSLAVFSVPVEKASAVPSALDNVWSSAMSLMSIVSIPFMLFGGKYLNEGRVPSTLHSLPTGMSKTTRIRILGLFATACLALLLLVGWGVPRGDPYSIAFAVAMQGVPLNLYFLVPLELLAAWMPNRPGLAVGCGQTAFGLGTMFFSGVFESFIARFGVIYAVYLSVVVLMAPGLLVSFLLQWPPLEQRSSHQSSAESSDGAEAEVRTITLRKLLRLSMFWLCVFSIMVSQTGFVFISYFFQIGLSFNQSMHSLVKVFEIISFLSAFSRSFTGMLADCFKWGRGFFSLGSKNVMVCALASQTLLFVMLIIFSNSYNFTGFAVAAGLIVTTLATGECLSALLMRDIFGSQNSSVAFGAGASIGFGAGCFIPPLWFTAIRSHMESLEVSPSAYNLFYLICIFWSIAGFTATVTLSRYTPEIVSRDAKKPQPLSTGSTGDTTSSAFSQMEDAPLVGSSIMNGYGATEEE